MPVRPEKIKLRDMVELVENNAFDVPEIQRTFNRRERWVAELVDSLHRGVPIGSILVWIPESRTGPTAGRYRQHSNATWWILDGQQRLTALLAALGMRPPWVPEERWSRMAGNSLEIGVGVDHSGRPQFRPLRPDTSIHIPLGKLLSADNVHAVLDGHGITGARAVETCIALRERLNNAEIALSYLPGDYATAALGFARHNKRSSNAALKPEELSLCLLGASHPALQREYIDPLLAEVEDRGLGRTITRRRVSMVLERLLPAKPSSEAISNGSLTQQDIGHAAERTIRAFHKVISMLRECGITRDELMPSPSIVIPLAHLFESFPQAGRDDFAKRWMTHVVTQHYYQLGAYGSRQDANHIRASGTYERAKTALVAALPNDALPEFVEGRLHARSTHSNFGDPGFLYALACTEHSNGPVTDLRDPSIVYPDSRLRLRPLCTYQDRNLLVQFAFMTEETGHRVLAHGGWSPGSYEEVRCSDAALAAQAIPLPQGGIAPKEVGTWLLEQRSRPLASIIERYRSTIRPLR